MFKIQKSIIEQYYDLKVVAISSLANHLDANIFLVETTTGKFVLKELTDHFLNHPENEGELVEYLANQGIKVSKLLKNNKNEHITYYNEKKFHLQEYLKGNTLSLNSAPDWYLKESAQLLGMIQKSLIKYKKLPTLFDANFLNNSTIQETKQAILKQLDNANENASLIRNLNRRLEHLAKVSHFEFDADKLTYTNSHGDYYVSQIIEANQELTVIDWTGACFLPACFEVIMSYSYAAPSCKEGEISVTGLNKYLENYFKYFKLKDYDIKMMPYFYYFQLATCNFIPPYNELPEDYLKIAQHCDKIMEWLFDHVETLSNELCQSMV